MKPLQKSPIFRILFLGMVFSNAVFISWIGVRYVSNIQKNAKQVRLQANGQMIYISLFTHSMRILGDHSNFKDSKQFFLDHLRASSIREKTSNQYFVYMVTNEILEVPWNFFAASVLPGAEGDFSKDGASSLPTFQSGDNFWSVVADLTLEDSGAPYLVSRNLAEEQLIPQNQTADPPQMDRSLFNEAYVVVIRVGGSAEIIPIDELTWERLNPTGLSNKILHPGDPLGEVAN